MEVRTEWDRKNTTEKQFKKDYRDCKYEAEKNVGDTHYGKNAAENSAITSIYGGGRAVKVTRLRHLCMENKDYIKGKAIPQ
jgi:hypothetical protein